MRSTNIILPDKLPEVKRLDNMCSDTFHINIITPMMGGGVEAGEVNESNPVRISELRGILRFWWRLIHNNNNSLLESESRLWGSTKNKSRVIIDVSDISPVKFRCYMKDFEFQRYDNEAYALFPVAPKRKYGQIVEGSGKDIAREGLNFTLRITYPREFQDEIRLTIASWIYFGGVGSRTRRGLGSLSCDNALPSVQEVLGAASSITLWRKSFDDTDALKPLKAWSYILGIYKDYRQQRNSTGDIKHPGRSRWPEPDSIRQITDCSLPRHRRPVNNIIAPVQSFPRAALGLPIIFKFKNDCTRDRIQSDLEPYQTTLKPKDDPEHDKKYNRMSSPVITKAMYEGNILYSAVVILPHDDFFSHGLELAEIPDHVIDEPEYDAVSGFEDFISAEGFQRVTA